MKAQILAWVPRLLVPLALVVAGAWLLYSDLGPGWRALLLQLAHGQRELAPRVMPSLVLGLGMFMLAPGLVLRSRVAWYGTLLMTLTAIICLVFGLSAQNGVLLGYFSLVAALLLVTGRSFDRSSLAAGTLLALAAITMLLQYATFGSYYLGDQFVPPVGDLGSAFYYAILTMSTLGYGNPADYGLDARLFTITVAVLGIAVFATAVTAVISPLITRSLQRVRMTERKSVRRTDHFVVVGDSSLAVNTCRELARSRHPFTRIMPAAASVDASEFPDVVTGDSSSADVLRKAGADAAIAVIAMSDDDSDNAFTVLAVQGLKGSARTVLAVNDASHLEQAKLVQPDVIIAPQVLGGTLAAMLAAGEPVPPNLALQHVVQEKKDPSSAAD